MKNKQSTFFKATTATVLAASSVAFVIPTASASFSDLKPSQYFYNDVLNLQARGIIHGFPDGTFKPGNHLTRGQAAKIIAGVLGLDTVNVKNPNFKDIPTTHQYYGAIAALKQAGIIDGYPDRTFRQGGKMERNHVAKILANAMKFTASGNSQLPFTDVRADYRDHIVALYERGITTGKTPTTFDGSSFVTRGQMAAFISRAEASANIPDDEVTVDGDTITFTISSYTNNTIKIGDKTYRYDDAVRPIFTQANKNALTGATVTATVENGVIKKINRLTLNRAGTANVRATFVAKATIDTLIINANYVVVKNLSVTGNATVTRKVTTDATFDGVNITGNFIIDDAEVSALASVNSVAQDAVGPTIYFNHSTAANIRIEVSGTKIVTNGTIAKMTIAANVTAVHLNGKVTQLIIEGSSTVTLTGTADIAELILSGAAKLLLEINGTIASLVVNDKEARITLGPNVKITKLTIPSGTTAATIVTNYANVKDQITTTIIGNSSSGGGGGGSSSGGGGSGGGGTTTTVDTAALQAAITSADTTLTKITDSAKKAALAQAITTAKEVLAKKNVTKAQVDAAIIALNKAVLAAQRPTGAVLLDEIEFTFDSSIATSDIAAIDTLAIQIGADNANPFEISKDATVKLSPFTLTLANYSVTTADTITINVSTQLGQTISTPSKYLIEYDALNGWIARKLP